MKFADLVKEIALGALRQGAQDRERQRLAAIRRNRPVRTDKLGRHSRPANLTKTKR
jgi:hypothetical protein